MSLQSALPVLLSWAAHLSGYPMPAQTPEIEFRPHTFFVQEVCGGKECKAVGWYNDQGIVYIDEQYRDDESGFGSSLLVHELTHYLQHRSGRYDSHSCEDSLAREREAYLVQNNFILESQGSFALIKPAPTSCAYPSSASTAP